MEAICPACKRALFILEWHRVEIDYCPRCHGIWIDDGELELLCGRELQDPLECFAVGAVVGDSESAGAHKKRKRRCVRCRRRMTEVTIGTDGTIHVDRCPRHGIWFDAGELQQLLRSAGSDAGPALSFLQELFTSPPVESSESQ